MATIADAQRAVLLEAFPDDVTLTNTDLLELFWAEYNAGVKPRGTAALRTFYEAEGATGGSFQDLEYNFWTTWEVPV